MTKSQQRAEQAALFPQTPSPHTVPQCSDVGCPTLVNTKGSALNYISGASRQRNMAQMKEHVKAPEKIQLSDEDIANLSHVQFKTLVIRLLTNGSVWLLNRGKNEGYEK